MGITLVIAEAEDIVVYEMVNGLFNEVGKISFKKTPNHDTIVQYVTALSQVVNNGKKPDAAARKRHPTAKKAPAKKRTKGEINMNPIKNEHLMFMALSGFEEWATATVAREKMGNYSSESAFYSTVRRLYLNEMVEKRDEPLAERQARDAHGRVCSQYRLTEQGFAKLFALRGKAQDGA